MNGIGGEDNDLEQGFGNVPHVSFGQRKHPEAVMMRTAMMMRDERERDLGSRDGATQARNTESDVMVRSSCLPF